MDDDVAKALSFAGEMLGSSIGDHLVAQGYPNNLHVIAEKDRIVVASPHRQLRERETGNSSEPAHGLMEAAGRAAAPGAVKALAELLAEVIK